MFDFKTLKLTNFVFCLIGDKKCSFSVMIVLISSLNLKLLISLKGKLLSPLKKYFIELDYSNVDISQSNLISLVQAYRLLFCFKN